MRRAEELLKLCGKIYVYLKDENMEKIFLEDVEKSGFTFSDGALPTSRPGNDLYCLTTDYQICHVGFVGHMAFQSAQAGGQQLFRIDYEEFAAAGTGNRRS